MQQTRQIVSPPRSVLKALARAPADFGLRSVKSVLNSAGALKRVTDEPEDIILLRAIRDMCAPPGSCASFKHAIFLECM